MLINFDSFVFFTLCLYALGSLTSKSLLSLAGTLAVLAVLWALVSKRFTNRAAHKGMIICALLWFAFSMCNLLLRPLEGNWTSSIGRIPILLVPLLGLAQLRLSESRHRLLLIFLVIGAVSALFRSGYTVFVVHQPGAGFFGNPIYFAYAALPVVVYFFESLVEDAQHRRLKVIGLCASLGALLLSGSRMALLFTLAFFCLRLLWVSVQRRHIKGAAALVGCVVAVFASLVLWVPFINEKFTRLFDAQDPSRVWRLTAWKHNWSLFLKHPYFGTGFQNNGIDTAVQTELAGHWLPGHLIYAHSIYFQWLTEGGLVGSVLVLSYFALLMRQGRRIFWVVLALAITGLTENVLTNFAPLYGFMFIMALSQIQQSQARPES
jgi:O-antigen ligase